MSENTRMNIFTVCATAFLGAALIVAPVAYAYAVRGTEEDRFERQKAWQHEVEQERTALHRLLNS